MTTTDRAPTGGQAFPTSTHQDGPYGGMTLRDYFAARALPVCMSVKGTGDPQTQARVVATMAYLMADAMLEARDR